METKRTKQAKTKVQAIKPAPQAIEPPDGWELHSRFGYMRCDPTQTGPLVRLADVLHWIEKSRSLPRVAALAVLCDAMPPEVMQWLYWVQPSDYAKPVPVDWMCGYKTAAQIKAKGEAERRESIQAGLQREFENQRNGWFQSPWRFEGVGRQNTLSQPEPTEPGLPALLKFLRHWWAHPKFNNRSTCDILDDPRMKGLIDLAIRLDKAAALWGYGQILRAIDSEPSTFAELVALRKAKPGSQWTAAQRQILKFEVDKRINQPGHRKDIAEALGVKPQRIGQLIDSNWQPKRRPAANLHSVKG